MVQMYTRIDNFHDVIVRETDSNFEVELRCRDNILFPFQSSHHVEFPKENESAERNASNLYNNILEAITKKDK